ncbi:DUF4112 domain-containing protein [Piscinibacter sakaiensis]|uniref:DUF4112 domain-containing protein n=1 Tax=Piscinibacter sakaiensis TaxID=1547922 RepID=UPI003AB08F9A
MTDDEIARRVRRSRQWANLLDAAWGIPYTRWRFGLDSLIGILPIAGDLAGAALGLGIVWQARQAAAPRSLQVKLLGNIGLDLVLGAVPIVGDIADVAFRKNQRNAALLEKWAAQRQAATPRRA